MKPNSWIFIIALLLGKPKSSGAQIWRYGKYDPKAEIAFDKSLDEEACSVINKSEIFAGEKSTYKIRTFCIQSFDSIHSKIAISERSHGHNLWIEGANDRIKIEDISGLEKVHFLRPELLEVVYSPRGGSDQGFEYVMILGVNKKRLCIIAEFLTINEYTVPDNDSLFGYHLHEIRLKLKGQALHDCELTVNVMDRFRSGESPSKNYDRKTMYVLIFDENRKIFHNKIRHLDADFHMDTSAGKSRHLTGDYPMVGLGAEEKYYYIDNEWYGLTRDDSGKKSTLSKVHKH